MNSSNLIKIIGGILFVGLCAMLVLLYLGSGATQKSSAIPQLFTDQRNQLATMLQELSALPDVDLGTLTVFEARSDFTGASELVQRVLEQNKETVKRIEALKTATRTLLLNAQEITDIELRNNALEALLELDNGNTAMEKQFNIRTIIFKSLIKYYNDRAAKRKVSAPNLDNDFKLIDEYTNAAKIAYDSFNQKIRNFDRLAGLR